MRSRTEFASEDVLASRYAGAAGLRGAVSQLTMTTPGFCSVRTELVLLFRPRGIPLLA